MIPKETIDQIMDTARIEDVVGDFVSLKKRGVNYLGLCPFHNEKTPSFNVSPVKGIYKCFGCGEGGNAVNFVMAHEHYSYPEALKFLAKRFNIEIEEEERTPEQMAALNERESLFVLNAFAQKFFADQLANTEEGQNIGFSYFKERGYNESTIENFALGYSPEAYDTFTKEAQKNAYQNEFLVKTGLSKERNGQLYDFLRGRVIFPIRNITGRVVGFGARTLKSDKKIPKYLNSPENEIYNKSKILYGLYEGKKAIVQKDNCLLVEGYTDVISMHLAGLENVVSSSGTSLTTGQVRLIKRYTNNITILYDGDPAGIKASFRGIDLILEEGMNVRVVLFPEGEDPDSYSKKVSAEELETFIAENARDFIVFKTDLLLGETGGDPIKKAALIHDIIESIALIPDHIVRSLYIKECSNLLEIQEQALINELNKLRRKKLSKSKEQVHENFSGAAEAILEPPPQQVEEKVDLSHEYAIIRILLTYGDKSIPIEVAGEDDTTQEVEMGVANYIISELDMDKLGFTKDTFQSIYEEYRKIITENGKPDQQYFFNHLKDDIRQTAVGVEMEHEKYTLSENWQEVYRIYTVTEDMKLRKLVHGALHSFKLRKVLGMIKEVEDELKDERDEAMLNKLLNRKKLLDNLKSDLSSTSGTVVIR